MKTALLLSLLTATFLTTAQAKPIFGKVESYIIVKTGEVVSIATNEISDDGQSANFYNYGARKRMDIDMSEVSKSTRAEIAGVKAGKHILITTPAGASKVTITRYCQVFGLYESKQAYVGCKTYEADKIDGYQMPVSLSYIVQNVEQVVAEVESLDNFSHGDVAELRIETKLIKAQKRVKILAIFSNGEALVESSLAGLNFLNSSGTLHRYGVERVKLQDLNKLN